MRTQEITRNTAETKIQLRLNVDGSGKSVLNTGCGFFDHMLTNMAKHGRFDLDIQCQGDVEVDYHHTVEDIGIVLGRALKEALGECRGIVRYGSSFVPMDESLVLVALDISGRSYLVYDVEIGASKVGDFDTELAEEFFVALTRTMGLTLHIKKINGTNAHHILEATFKALGRALRQAVAIDPAAAGEIPSTKGTLL